MIVSNILRALEKVTAKVKSKSGETKQMERMRNITVEKLIEKFKNLFAVNVEDCITRVNCVSNRVSAQNQLKEKLFFKSYCCSFGFH